MKVVNIFLKVKVVDITNVKIVAILKVKVVDVMNVKVVAILKVEVVDILPQSQARPL